jgi:hypothetical protein
MCKNFMRLYVLSFTAFELNSAAYSAPNICKGSSVVISRSFHSEAVVWDIDTA